MTGRRYQNHSDGIWDDGEWISWDYINEQLHVQERRAEFPAANPDLIAVFDDLVSVAAEYKAITGRYLSIFGELGELYAEIRYGIKRHRPHAAGADGKLGNEFVEVKTISPGKRVQKVQVKRAGNFSRLVIVRINEDFEFESKMIERSALHKGLGKRAVVSWASTPGDAASKGVCQEFCV